MMNNLFSIFDPSTSYLFSNNWMSMNISLILLPFVFWAYPSRTLKSLKYLKKFITNELKNNLIKNNFKSTIMFFSLFWFILLNNVMGLYPYTFTATSHLLLTLTLSLPLWITMMIYGWMKLYNHMFIHLVPMGTPMILSFFMVFIETVSNVIRPLTLSVRLAANMIAGHLLLSLLSGISENSPYIFLPTFLIIMMLLCLEYAVAIIQSYVFITLMSLYLNEIN